MCGIRSARAQIFYLFLPVELSIAGLLAMFIAINLKSCNGESVSPATTSQTTTEAP